MDAIETTQMTKEQKREQLLYGIAAFALLIIGLWIDSNF